MTYLTPVKSIRKKCLECSSTPKMVRECQERDCPLYLYRLGHNPRRKGVGVIKNLGSYCKKQPT